jgi:hypothetical protein
VLVSPLADRERLVSVRGRAALLGARVAMVPTVTRNRLRSKDPVCPRVSRRRARWLTPDGRRGAPAVVAEPGCGQAGTARRVSARTCVIWFTT